MAAKKTIVAIIIGIIIIGFTVFYFADNPVLTVALNTIIMDQDMIEKNIFEYYKKHLNREPDISGLSHFKQRILEGQSFEWVEEQIQNSEEAKVLRFNIEIESKITEFYNTYLKRQPDPEGMIYWKQQVLDGKSYDWIENEFKNSEEAKLNLE